MNRDSRPDTMTDEAIARLSPNEIACLELVASGLGSKEIARELGGSPHTVDARLKSACAKLGTRSRFHAASLFREARGGAPVTVTAADTKLVYEDRTLTSPPPTGDNGASAGEGERPGDLSNWQQADREAGASRRGRSWLEPTHPLAKFFGGENRLPIGERLVAIFAIAIGAAIAVGILANALVGISRLGSSL